MNLKNVAKRLSKVRDSIREHGGVSAEDEKELKALVQETIGVAKNDLSKLPKKSFSMPTPHNDNQQLSPDQRFRLSIIEKTGTGSASVH